MTDLSPALVGYQEAAHEELVAALDRSTAPVASLATLLGAQLDLVELTLDLARGAGAPVAALHRWLGWAATTARAMVLGRTRDPVHHRVAITWPDGRQHTLVRRWTEPAVEHPLSGARWRQALAVAWILGDDLLVDGLADPELVASLARHPRDREVRGNHRVPLAQLLAALARNEAVGDLPAATRLALTRDLHDLERPVDGLRLASDSLRADVLPVLPVVEALGLTAPPTGSLPAAFEAACGAMPRPLLLVGLAALARQRGAQEPPRSLLGDLGVPLLDAGSLVGAVHLDQLSATPPLHVAGHDLDSIALDHLAEALWHATSTDAWAAPATHRQRLENIEDRSLTRATPALVATMSAPLPLDLWRHALVHVVAHGRWAPRTHAQGFHLAIALNLVSRPVHEAPLGVRLAPAQLVRALAAFDETPFHDRLDPTRVAYAPDVGAELVPVIARIVGGEPAALDGVTLTPSLETIVLMQWALGGAAIAQDQRARIAAALRDLATRFQFGCGFVAADSTGTTRPLDREAIVAALVRVAGRRWIDTLPANHPLRPIDASTAATAEARRRRLLESALRALVSSVRNGVAALPAELADLVRSGRTIVPVVAPLYDDLLVELAQSPSLEAACAAIALRNVVTGALLHAGGTVSEDDARFLLRAGAIFEALPPDEQARWREDERTTRVKLWDHVDSETRGIVYASWADPAPSPPAPEPATPGRRRRIIG